MKLDPANATFDGGETDGIFEFNTPMVSSGTRFNLSERWYMNLKYGYDGFGVDDVSMGSDSIDSLLIAELAGSSVASAQLWLRLALK